MCVTCYVDEATRDRIIAYGAKFHEVTQSPYGKDDEIGMLNIVFVTHETVLLIAETVSAVNDRISTTRIRNRN